MVRSQGSSLGAILKRILGSILIRLLPKDYIDSSAPYRLLVYTIWCPLRIGLKTPVIITTIRLHVSIPVPTSKILFAGPI